MEDGFDMGKMIDQILAESGFSEQRASKMDVDDFLKLLTIFHKYGQYFLFPLFLLFLPFFTTSADRPLSQ